MKPRDEVLIAGTVDNIYHDRVYVRISESLVVERKPTDILPAAPPDLAALAREIRRDSLVEWLIAYSARSRAFKRFERIAEILRAVAAHAKDEQEPRAERMEYHFRRYRGNQLMAEEVYVHAYSEEEARAKALLRYRNAEDMGRLELVGTTAKGVAAMGGEG